MYTTLPDPWTLAFENRVKKHAPGCNDPYYRHIAQCASYTRKSYVRWTNIADTLSAVELNNAEIDDIPTQKTMACNVYNRSLNDIELPNCDLTDDFWC